MSNIFEMIKNHSSNEEYVIGDALMELFPIEYLKPSELNGASVRICCEETKQLDNDIITVINDIEELISENKISFSNKFEQNMIGSHGIMQPANGCIYSDRVLEVPSMVPNVWDIICSHYTIPE